MKVLVSILTFFVFAVHAQSSLLKTQYITVNGYTVRAIKVNPDEVSLHWKDTRGTPYATLSKVDGMLKRGHQQVLALMNAGIYSANLTPAGLYVERGERLHKLNTKSGKGNFHLTPNGVFFIDNGRASIVTTQAYQQYFQHQYSQFSVALQSGPMLVIDGEINAAFLPNSSSVYSRNGVCTADNGDLYFFATDNLPDVQVNLFTFARAAQMLGCTNALYLDGSISKLYVAGENTLFHFSQYVGILAVTRPEPQ